MKKVFIDGSAGTTGLRIVERLRTRKDIELVVPDEESRKDVEKRRIFLNEADVAILCLPDEAAVEACGLIENDSTVIIDTSCAHRTSEGWTYGFPELTGNREIIRNSKRISNPGCHASGFIALVAPLVENGIISKDAKLSAYSVTGYSGGGKKMIAEYEGENASKLISPRVYGISQSHKHLPEMRKYCSLSAAPVFSPIVSSYYSGMQVCVPLHKDDVKGTAHDVKALYKSYYDGKVIKYKEFIDENGFIRSDALCGSDKMHISVSGNEDRILLTALFDNLGKGASGAAIQNLNIVLSVDETAGLNLE
jgi:N-acetyl-gamma-glutamyl-phosphate reductase